MPNKRTTIVSPANTLAVFNTNNFYYRNRRVNITCIIFAPSGPVKRFLSVVTTFQKLFCPFVNLSGNAFHGQNPSINSMLFCAFQNVPIDVADGNTNNDSNINFIIL